MRKFDTARWRICRAIWWRHNNLMWCFAVAWFPRDLAGHVSGRCMGRWDWQLHKSRSVIKHIGCIIVVLRQNLLAFTGKRCLSINCLLLDFWFKLNHRTTIAHETASKELVHRFHWRGLVTRSTCQLIPNGKLIYTRADKSRDSKFVGNRIVHTDHQNTMWINFARRAVLPYSYKQNWKKYNAESK
jgi:hypothetical protein